MRNLLVLLIGFLILLAAFIILPIREHGETPDAKVPDMEKKKYIVTSKSIKAHWKKPFEITLIHNNDSHSVHDNIARTATLVEEIRKANDNTLLLSAGDVTSWNIGAKREDAIANAFFMNHFGYDGMVLGNHEFDLGEGIVNHEALGNYIKDSAYPVLAGNVDFSRDEFLEPLADYSYSDEPVEGRINKGYTITVGEEQIGIFGITHYKDVVTVPGDVSFADYTETAKEAVAHFESQGINKIIALTHIGIGNDRRLAEAVPEIDVIIGGHSHVTTSPPNKIGDTLVLQTGEYNTYLGELKLAFDEKGKISDHQGKLHKVAEAEHHPMTTELLSIYNQAIQLKINTYADLMQYAEEFGIEATDFELAE
ncbi:bifunctional metallophosphatase/5'-nucleotidase [Planococcus sp. X10-3]|uniref:bifunctional metallophosphatase/5'-nucleotidase n=1 Tax=Planococcus sp. X10-3 TaxID=3061240 RepID=UPI003BB14529